MRGRGVTWSAMVSRAREGRRFECFMIGLHLPMFAIVYTDELRMMYYTRKPSLISTGNSGKTVKFWDNVLLILERRKISVRSLALDVGVTPGAMSRYSRGSMPGLDVAARIAERLGISLDSLVWGNLEEEGFSVSRCRAPEEHELLHELTKRYGIDELLRISELATQPVSWEIMSVLGARYPETMTFDDLVAAMGDFSPEDIKLSLLALRRCGAVEEEKVKEEEGRIRYGVTKPVANFNAREIGDISEHVKRAMRVIFGRVLPALERQDGSGSLITVNARVPEESAGELARELRSVVKRRCQEMLEETGTAELDVVFGVAISPKAR